MLVRRVDRALGDKKASLIDMTYDQYRDWLLSATDARNKYLSGKLTEEEAMAIIYMPTKDEMIESMGGKGSIKDRIPEATYQHPIIGSQRQRNADKKRKAD